MSLPISVGHLYKVASNFIGKNAPAILTGLGSVGIVASNYLSYRAGDKAGRILDVVPEEEKDTFYKKAKLTWRVWTPPLALAAVSVVCVVGANSIHAKRLAAIAGVAALSEKTLKEYQEKAVEMFGEAGDRKVRDAVVDDQMTEQPLSKNVVYDTGGEFIFYDAFSGRYFKSTMAKVDHATSLVNRDVFNDSFVTVNQLYSYLGLDPIEIGDHVGWEAGNLVELHFNHKVTDNNQPCVAISFRYDTSRL